MWLLLQCQEKIRRDGHLLCLSVNYYGIEIEIFVCFSFDEDFGDDDDEPLDDVANDEVCN